MVCIMEGCLWLFFVGAIVMINNCFCQKKNPLELQVGSDV